MSEKIRIRPQQARAMEYVLTVPMRLTKRFAFVWCDRKPTDPRPAPLPHPNTFSSLLIHGWVAGTPDRRAGFTPQGVTIAQHVTGHTGNIAHYRPASAIEPRMILDLEGDEYATFGDEPGAPSIYQYETATVLDMDEERRRDLGPVQAGWLWLWVATASEDQVIAFPADHWVRVVGHYTMADEPDLWEGA